MPKLSAARVKLPAWTTLTKAANSAISIVILDDNGKW
jgi:hypothetical protein